MEDNVKVLTLGSIATLKELVGGEGGVNLLTEYTVSPESGSVYDAVYINSKLNDTAVVLGEGATQPETSASRKLAVVIGKDASAQLASGQIGTYSVVIGYNASATVSTGNNYSGIAIGGNSTASGYGIAIGGYAKALSSGAVAIGTSAQAKGNSIALGDNAANTPTRNVAEVSIGNPDGTLGVAKTRFLANVTAGTLDTDATNLKQVRDAVIGDVLYTSTEAESTITLSTPVSQYEKVEVIGSWTMPYTELNTPLQIIGNWHINDQDDSRAFQLRAVDMDPTNTERTEVVETWQFTNATTLELASGTQISGTLTDPTIEAMDTPNIIITKVIGIKAI